MQQLIFACIYKQICTIKNDVKKIILSICLNVAILFLMFIRTKSSGFYGFDFCMLMLIYIIIWCVMMSFSIVSDIVIESNEEGIVQQIFMSSYSIGAYIFMQVLLKSIYSMFFIWVILGITNIFTGFLTLTNMLSFIMTLLLGVFSIIGVGYIISGISILVNNRIVSLGLKMAFLYVIIGTNENMFLPFSKCKIMLADLIINKQCLWQQLTSDIVALCVNSLMFLLLGYSFFYIITLRELRLKEDY